MIVIAAVITSLFAVFFHKRLLFTMFDKETAKAYGVKTHHVETIFSLVLATVIIASMSAIGVTMLATGDSCSGRIREDAYKQIPNNDPPIYSYRMYYLICRDVCQLFFEIQHQVLP